MKGWSILLVGGLLLATFNGCAPDDTQQGPGSLAQRCVATRPSVPQTIFFPMDSGFSLESMVWPAPSQSPPGGVIFVSGVDGGWVEPSDGIYGKIAEALSLNCVEAVFVRYRFPGDLETSVADALQGARYLRNRKVEKMALLGWSFGGAVIAHAAVQIPETVTIVGFAPQSLDTEPVAQFSRQSILLIHSWDDENVPFEASQQILDEAPIDTRKRLVELEGYDHQLTGADEAVRPVVLSWLKEELGLSAF